MNNSFDNVQSDSVDFQAAMAWEASETLERMGVQNMDEKDWFCGFCGQPVSKGEWCPVCTDGQHDEDCPDDVAVRFRDTQEIVWQGSREDFARNFPNGLDAENQVNFETVWK